MKADIYPVITLYQPWATWIMRFMKKIETREHDRFKSLKGKRILIHSGKKTDTSELVLNNRYVTREQLIYKPEEVINGYILGSAYVEAVGWLDDSHSKKALIDCGSTRRYGLFLDGIKPLDYPLPVKGQMGIWYYDLYNQKKVSKSEYNPVEKE